MQLSRAAFAVLASNILFGIASGFAISWLPLRLDIMGTSPAWIGVQSSTMSISVFITGIFFGRLLPKIGYRGALNFGCALYILSMVSLLFYEDYWWWMFWRLIGGFGVSLHWIGSESWLNSMATKENRTKLMGLYVACFIGGMAIGPLLNTQTGIAGDAPILTIIILATLALGASSLTGRETAKYEIIKLRDFLVIYKEIPQLLIFVIIMALAQGAAISMLSYYGVQKGVDADRALVMVSFFLIGSVVFQFFIGYLGDKFGIESLLMKMSIFAFLTVFLLPYFLDYDYLLYPLLLLRGGVLFGLYTLALSQLGSIYGHTNKMAAANALLILFWEMGAMSAGPFTGFVMELFGAEGFNIVQAFACGLLIITCYWQNAKAKKFK